MAILPARRLVIAACALVLGCRERFDLQVDAAAPDDATPDAPPLPVNVCGVVSHPIPAVAPATELAVAANRAGSGHYAAWANQGAVTGVRLDGLAGIVAPPATIIDGPVAGVAGLVDTGTAVLVAATMPGPGVAVWSLGADLAAPKKLRDEPSLPAREPFASNTSHTPRIWVRAMGTNLVGAAIRDDGAMGADNRYIGAGKISAISLDDGPDHSHLTWSEDLGAGGSRCFASDIDYQGPAANVPPSGIGALVDDCAAVRTASGPPAADSMIVVSQTAGHQIEARYLASTGNVTRTMSFHGRAPKVRFDGALFWIAWIDEGPRDELHLASFDLTGKVNDAAAPGWVPVGDEAFQLVRRGTTVSLVVLGRDALSYLLTCP